MDSNSIHNNEFDLDTNQNENLIIRFGRFLYSHLSHRNFIMLFIILISVPLIVVGYMVYLSKDNLQLLLDNLIAIFVSLLIAVFFLTVISYGKISYCNYCKEPFATVPLKRKLVGQTNYRDSELYKVVEYRKCEHCGKITSKEYTEEYTKDTNEGL